VALPVFSMSFRRFNRTDIFMGIFLFLALITRLQIPENLIYWKRAIFLFFPFVYVIFRSVFFLLTDSLEVKKKESASGKTIWWLIVSGIYSPAIIFLYFKYFSHSISRIYGFGQFTESFHYNIGVFLYLLLVFLAAIVGFNWRIFVRSQKTAKLLAICLVFFVLISSLINGFNVAKIFLPANIRYSYTDNLKYTKMIPEGEMVNADEQGFRAFAYLSKQDFYFNHDGGPNPVPYKEVFERGDLRYFVLNVEEFYRGRWGLTNKFRLAFIKQAYPDLKLLDVFMASRVPLAIYDKYGGR